VAHSSSSVLLITSAAGLKQGLYYRWFAVQCKCTLAVLKACTAASHSVLATDGLETVLVCCELLSETVKAVLPMFVWYSGC
jgi:hypothetical protein